MAGENVAELEPQLMSGLALDGVEAVIVEHTCKPLGGLLPAPGGNEEVDEVLDVGRVEEEVAAEDAERGLDGDAGERDEGEVGLPDAVVLGDRKSA